MIPSPNLDDRTHADIVAECIRLIPQYCPEWTNHNPSDPGITLIELFGWMTEMVIYRLNKVTDKNFLAFLDLMGVTLQPPQPARTFLTFALSKGAPLAHVPEGTRVQTTGGDSPVVFETTRPLVVIPTQLVKCFSQFHDVYSDNTPFVEGTRREGFEIFMGAKSIERAIYLGDERFAALNENAVLYVRFETPESPEGDFPRLLEWEYWNGRRWKELSLATVAVDRNTVAFFGPPEMETCEVEGIESFWIRGRLTEVPGKPQDTILDWVKTKIEVLGEGVQPDAVFTNMEGGVFLTPDLTKNFYPFGNEPKFDYALYLASEELLSQPGAQLRVEVQLSDPTQIDAPNASDDLQIAWEYWDGKKWRELGIATPKGRKDWELHQFNDTTLAFTKSGEFSFRRPADMQQCEVNGLANFWIRGRIASGNFGSRGTYELVEDRWIWREPNPLRPPAFREISLKYVEDEHLIQKAIVFNDFNYLDVTDRVQTEYKHFQAFEAVSEESPSLYLGFDTSFPNDRILIYFNTTEKVALDLSAEFRQHLVDYYAQRQKQIQNEQRVVWEYFAGREWKNLFPSDSTNNFTQSGFLEFLGPTDHRPSKRFGENLYWIRCRLEMGGYDQLPRINHVVLNTVPAANIETHHEEILGQSDGTALQSFEFHHKPCLDGQQVLVLEKDEPTAEEAETIRLEEGEDAIQKDPDGKGFWVRWHQVDSFYDSGPNSRHYVKETVTSSIQFGNGRKGKIPPEGDHNIKSPRYQSGGGVDGNVAVGTVNSLSNPIAYIDRVYNHYPASGGSDQESVDEAKLRGPHTIKSRNRAVTAEDFTWLAKQASSSVARAHCLAARDREGEVKVIIVPKTDERTMDLARRLTPTSELLRRVKLFLDTRRLVSTIVNVVRPRYVEVSLQVEVIRNPSASGDRLKRDIETALRRYLHPLLGGRSGEGWEFGKHVFKVDLYHVIEEVAGVEFVDRIDIFDEDRKVHIDSVRLNEDELVYLVDVEVREKARERIG
ncbi:MAG: putative baseplate assembly protein [Myxococcota bacterium]|jgi:hypothetical protein|nr:putative baseplate assembly protein [Myxococcota bacterium]